MATAAMLSLDHGEFSYDGRRTIFRGVNLSVAEGEVMCILGPNGSGKSTLIKCLANLLPLGHGNLRLNGTLVGDLSSRQIAGTLGYVPQTSSTPFPFLVRDMVVMGRAPHLSLMASPGRRDHELAEQAMATVGITHLADRSCMEISGGEARLVLIARVLTQQPRILLLDEPTSHLDIANQIVTLKLVRKLAAEGLTIIMASHFPEHAFAVACRVALLHQGDLVVAGNPDEIINPAIIQQVYGVEVKILPLPDCLPTKACIPLLEGHTREVS